MRQNTHCLGDLCLLLARFTCLPLPKAWQSPAERLGYAMRWLPLWGLLSGAAVYGSLRWLVVVPRPINAMVAVGVNWFCSGAFLTREMMGLADGLPFTDADASDVQATDSVPGEKAATLAVRIGLSGLCSGMLRLVALYLIYLFLLRHPGYPLQTVIGAAIVPTLIFCWLVWQFPARSPRIWQPGFSSRCFVFVCVEGAVFLLLFFRLSLIAGFLTALLGAYLFATIRVRYRYGLEPVCYGGVAAWCELLCYLGCLILEIMIH